MAEQDDYIDYATEEHSVAWLLNKRNSFESEWQRIKTTLNAQFNNRGKNIAMECLQFGGNSEFWADFPDEREIALYFKHCYDYAVNYIGYLSTDKNIVCALTVTEENRRNLFVYYLPVTDKWKVKVLNDNAKANGRKFQKYDADGNPVYTERHSTTNPLLCHSEFWKQRGGLTSYSDLQEDFYQVISKRYGAVRGESYSLLKNTNKEQQYRYARYPGDDKDILPPIKGIWE